MGSAAEHGPQRGHLVGEAGGVITRHELDQRQVRPRHVDVDGVSGATLTGKGINHFLKEDLEAYEPYFETKRKDQVQNEPAGEQQ